MANRIDKSDLKEKLSQGKSYREIADFFGVKESTICTKVSLMRKRGELKAGDRRRKEQPLKNSDCDKLHCNTCNEKCMEYIVAKLLLDNNFSRIEGVGYVRL